MWDELMDLSCDEVSVDVCSKVEALVEIVKEARIWVMGYESPHPVHPENWLKLRNILGLRGSEQR